MTNTSTKTILPAFLLCTFLGTLGLHRFYAGRVGSGIAMLLITLTLIGLLVTSLWALIDWIIILTGNFRDGDGQKITQWT